MTQYPKGEVADSRDHPLFLDKELDDLELDPYAFRVYCRLVRRFSQEKGVYESVPKMAKGCCMSERKVRYALKTLFDLGLITRERRQGGTTTYRLANKSQWKREVAEEPTPTPEPAPAPDAGEKEAETPAPDAGGAAPHAGGGLHHMQGTPAPHAAKEYPFKKSQEDNPTKKPPPTPPAKSDGDDGPKEDKDKHDLPDYIDAELWREWEQYRRERKKTLTPTTVSRQLSRLQRMHDEGQDVGAVIEQSIAQGWTGLFPIKQDQRNGRQKRRNPNQIDPAEAFARIRAAAFSTASP